VHPCSDSRAGQERRGFEERQPHHAGIAALERFDEDGGAPLDRVGASLVARLACFPVALDLLRLERALRLAARGQRLISIFSSDLEPPIYDQPAFLNTIKRFVLGQKFAKVRVLVREPGRMISNNNRFVSMARRLTSYLEIRVLAAELRQQTASYCIADDRAIVYRLRADRWDGISSLNNPPVARQYLQEFDVAWQASTDDQHQRMGAM